MKQYLTFTFYILLFTLLTACGSTPNSSQDAGALTFNIKLSRPATAYLTAYLTGNDICIDYGVATVTAIVTDSSGKTVTSGSWSCSAHQGSITGIPSENKIGGQVLNYQFPLLLVFLTIGDHKRGQVLKSHLFTPPAKASEAINY